MVVVSRHIDIDAPVARVFAFMADPAARAALNPDTTPIRIELEDGLPLHAGSVAHFRLQADNHIVDFRARVRRFERDQLIESVSDSAIPVEVRIETTDAGGGTRLVQTERFEPTDEMLADTTESALPRPIQLMLTPLLALIEPDYARRLRRRQEELLEDRLGRRLESWLEAIKRSLENGA
jgi:uncharacterized protein YndB with AHSA1/START domain